MENSIIQIIDEDRCTGCALCYNVCTSEAIEIELSNYGFYLPVIDQNKCLNCGKCLLSCPINLKKKDKHELNMNLDIKVYGAWSNDENIRMKSSSGGIFSELAISIIQEGGVVFGAGWNQDYGLLEHMAVSSVETLENLRGSKYIQSYVGKSYEKIKNFIVQGKRILFVGTPCQVAGLKSMVKNENLYTVDLICHGIPSMLVFRKYLASKIGTRKIKEFSFRDKEFGWNKYGIKIKTDDDYIYHSIYKFDPFMVGYLRNLYLNKVCYSCPFSDMPRVGDITLGDFWGVDKKYYDQNGVSAVIVNNVHGQKLFEKIVLNNAVQVFETNIETIANYNKRLVNGQCSIPVFRNETLTELVNYNFDYIEKYINIPDPNILQKLKVNKKKIIIFGTGNASKLLVDLLIEKKIDDRIGYFIDNDRLKWGKTLMLKAVKNPETILGEKKELILIIIASSYYDQIKTQLTQLGFIEGRHFINGMDLL